MKQYWMNWKKIGYKFLPVNRLDRPGGGIGLPFNNYLDIMEPDKGHYDSYTYIILKLKLNSEVITFCIINDHKNLIMFGDINIHYEDTEDLDKQGFDDLLNTF